MNNNSTDPLARFMAAYTLLLFVILGVAAFALAGIGAVILLAVTVLIVVGVAADGIDAEREHVAVMGDHYRPR